MQIELNGKEFRLRCDMRALANAKRESNIDIGNLGDDVVEVGTFVYYMAQSGAKHAGVLRTYRDSRPRKIGNRYHFAHGWWRGKKKVKRNR